MISSKRTALTERCQRCLFCIFMFVENAILYIDMGVQEKSNDSNLATPNHAMPQYKRAT